LIQKIFSCIMRFFQDLTRLKSHEEEKPECACLAGPGRIGGRNDVGGCIQSEAGGPPQELPLVDVVTVKPRALSLSAELPGRIEPVRVAEVRARVPGIVLSRNFKEGSDVKAGEVLFNIDPAPLRAALSRARGELARAEAALSEAQSVVRRYEPLVAQEAVSRQDFDSAKAALHSAMATRQSAQAEVEAARLNLDYATVRAPIAGRIGRALVTEGALVGQGRPHRWR
jgi:multidrug efflux system membrane fusion protein